MIYNMKEINDKLDNISGLITTINTTVKSINQRLDELIKALHDYDDDLSTFDDEPLQGPCSKYDAEQWDEERMDIIGQNGNEGTHYVTNEEADEDAFNDYGMRVDKDKSNDTQTKHTGETKKRNKRKYYKPKQ